MFGHLQKILSPVSECNSRVTETRERWAKMLEQEQQKADQNIKKEEPPKTS